jgi:transcriptional regulator of arginine metabolism
VQKTFRQGQILKLIQTKELHTQEEVAHELKNSFGIAASQVTVSRDIQELGLVKTPQGYRQMQKERPGPDLPTVVSEFLQDVRVAQNLVVLKTSSGNANALAVALDKDNWAEIVGTIAGDDTILVIAPDQATAEKIREKLLAIMAS